MRRMATEGARREKKVRLDGKVEEQEKEDQWRGRRMVVVVAATKKKKANAEQRKQVKWSYNAPCNVSVFVCSPVEIPVNIPI